MFAIAAHGNAEIVPPASINSAVSIGFARIVILFLPPTDPRCQFLASYLFATGASERRRKQHSPKLLILIVGGGHVRDRSLICPMLSPTMPIAPIATPGPDAPPAPIHNGKAYWIKVSGKPDGPFTVTNQRNGFSKAYGAAPGS